MTWWVARRGEASPSVGSSTLGELTQVTKPLQAFDASFLED